jgi:hypothetical protein
MSISASSNREGALAAGTQLVGSPAQVRLGVVGIVLKAVAITAKSRVSTGMGPHLAREVDPTTLSTGVRPG